MREIKFRLVQNDKIVGYERHRLTYVGGDKTIYIAIEHSPDGVGFCDVLRTDVKWHWIKHSKKEQYTGLKDFQRTEEYPEGRRIYEGDIVRLCYGIPPTFDTLIIEYAADEVVADISVSGWWMRNIRPNGVSGSLCKTYENDLEVIGTIHQNPEL